MLSPIHNPPLTPCKGLNLWIPHFDFIHETFKVFNFGENFRKWIKMDYAPKNWFVFCKNISLLATLFMTRVAKAAKTSQ